MSFRYATTIAVLGGGQLGRMLVQTAIDFDLTIKCLDPDSNAPCKDIAHQFTVGSLNDYDTVLAFAQDADVVTVEVENVSLEALEELERLGKKVFPQPSVLRKIKDKRLQKQFFVDNNLPTAEFILIENLLDLEENASFLPAVHKIGEGGYDGKGVQVMKNKDDIKKGFDAPGILEKLVDFEKELAVVVARNEDGELKTFPVVEMVFHPAANLVEYLFSPAAVSDKVSAEAQRIAKETAEAFGVVGLLAVEMFLTRSGEILINEVAPRPHNSGHQTMKGNDVSQYEQHLRAILNLPLGATTPRGLSAMVNLLGEENHEGNAVYEGMNEVLKIEGVHPFLYGKKITKPFRKMGHVTILDDQLDSLKEKVEFVKNTLKVISS
jgi:5-(carboxyamino)imidazole ribonucleotide synthase